MLTIGVKAPDFTLKDESKNDHNLSDYLGKWVVLYFYPKDDTPGCTTEACNFRDDYSNYQQVDVIILGVSPDSPEKHAKFKAKYQLPFSLLADEGHQICELYGVWGEKKFMGRTSDGVHRTTFLIDGSGTIRQVYKNVKPAQHSEEILADLREYKDD